VADITCCGYYYEVGDELIGHTFTCPKCGVRTVFRKTFSGSYGTPPAVPRPMFTRNVATGRSVGVSYGGQRLRWGLNQKWLILGLMAALALIALGVTFYKNAIGG
jgi:predicted RNA-binding Zn-ribbon protein involved in translation (DUF1610 family)